MKVVLKDKTEIFITNEQSDKITTELLKEGDGFIKINGQTIRKSRIVEIRTNTLTSSDISDFNNLSIEKGNKCRGQYSIQNEINHIAKEHKDWAKKIQNKK